MRIFVNFDVKTDPNADLVSARYDQNLAESQLPADVRNYGVNIQKARSSPLVVLALFSPHKTYDSTLSRELREHDLIDQLLRANGVAQVNVFGAGQYAGYGYGSIPTPSASSASPVPDIVNALQKQNTVNPAGQIGAQPVPPRPGVHLYGPRPGPSRLPGGIRRHRAPANTDGSIVRLKDVARIELGAGVQRQREHRR